MKIINTLTPSTSTLLSCAGGALLLGSSLMAFAQYTGPGSQMEMTPLQSILDNPVDDQQVRLRGNLIQQLSQEKYVFSDGSKQIIVDIDEDDMPAVPVDATTVVEIVGEVDKDFMREIEIDVDSIVVAQP